MQNPSFTTWYPLLNCSLSGIADKRHKLRLNTQEIIPKNNKKRGREETSTNYQKATKERKQPEAINARKGQHAGLALSADEAGLQCKATLELCKP